MYEFALIVHSWLRWAVLLAGIAAIASLFKSEPLGRDRWGVAFVSLLDLQMLLGLILYFALSPNTRAMIADLGAAMRDPVARFWAVEHVGTMTLAVIAAHVGRVLARRAKTSSAQRLPLRPPRRPP